MAVTDSTPNFLARCNALGLTEAVQDKLVEAGLDTISKFAFSSSYVPGCWRDGVDAPVVA